MGKFCTKCGRPLQEGEICSCQMKKQEVPQETVENKVEQPVVQNQQETQQQTINQQPTQGQQITVNVNTQAAQELFHGVLGCFLQLMKKPVTTGKELIREANMKIALSFIILQGVFSGFFALAVVGKYGSLLGALSGAASSLSSLSSGSMDTTLIIPYFRSFLVTVVFSIVLSCFLALLLLLGHMILKSPVSYRQMLAAVSIRSALLLPTILISLILFELQVTIGIFLFIAVNIWGLMAMFLALASWITDEKKNLFVLIMSLALLLFIIIMMFILSKIWTLYLPDSIRNMIKLTQQQIKNAGGLMNSLLRDMF